jgi:hypothetical protein
LDELLPAGNLERGAKISLAAQQAPIYIEKFAREFAVLMTSSAEDK